MSSNKNKVLILAVLVTIVFLLSGFMLWGSRKTIKVSKEDKTSLPPSIEKYYQESTPISGSVSEIKEISDLDNLSKEVDSMTVDIDSGLKQLDSDFSSF